MENNFLLNRQGEWSKTHPKLAGLPVRRMVQACKEGGIGEQGVCHSEGDYNCFDCVVLTSEMNLQGAILLPLLPGDLLARGVALLAHSPSLCFQ